MNAKKNDFFEIVSIIHEDGVMYRLYSDGNIYYFDKSNRLTKVDDELLIDKIAEHLQSADCDIL